MPACRFWAAWATCGTVCERIYREVKVLTIGGGTEEIMKDLAARQWHMI